jgi:hypothetical protein
LRRKDIPHLAPSVCRSGGGLLAELVVKLRHAAGLALWYLMIPPVFSPMEQHHRSFNDLGATLNRWDIVSEFEWGYVRVAGFAPWLERVFAPAASSCAWKNRGALQRTAVMANFQLSFSLIREIRKLVRNWRSRPSSAQRNSDGK